MKSGSFRYITPLYSLILPFQSSFLNLDENKSQNIYKNTRIRITRTEIMYNRHPQFHTDNTVIRFEGRITFPACTKEPSLNKIGPKVLCYWDWQTGWSPGCRIPLWGGNSRSPRTLRLCKAVGSFGKHLGDHDIRQTLTLCRRAWKNCGNAGNRTGGKPSHRTGASSSRSCAGVPRRQDQRQPSWITVQGQVGLAVHYVSKATSSLTNYSRTYH